MKRKLALGTPITQPYLNRMEEVFQITPFSQLLTPGTWPDEETVRSACMGSEVIILEADHIGAETLSAWREAGLKLLICTRGNPVNIDADACRRLGLTDADKPSILMVGDRKFDVLGARACGIDCAGVEFFGYALPGELAGAGAAAVAQTAEELEQFILTH